MLVSGLTVGMGYLIGGIVPLLPYLIIKDSVLTALWFVSSLFRCRLSLTVQVVYRGHRDRAHHFWRAKVVVHRRRTRCWRRALWCAVNASHRRYCSGCIVRRRQGARVINRTFGALGKGCCISVVPDSSGYSSLRMESIQQDWIGTCLWYIFSRRPPARPLRPLCRRLAPCRCTVLQSVIARTGIARRTVSLCWIRSACESSLLIAYGMRAYPSRPSASGASTRRVTARSPSAVFFPSEYFDILTSLGEVRDSRDDEGQT